MGDAHFRLDASEYCWECRLCGHRESWTTRDAAMLAGIQHRRVHPVLDHPVAQWMLVDPPGKYGRRLKSWESQLLR